EALGWCGIKIDEGVKEGGPHAPYRQSERRQIYRQYADRLVASGNAYYAFDKPETLQKLRNEAENRGEAFTYNYANRNSMENSHTLGEDEVRNRIEGGDQWVIRYKMPADEEVVMHDIIRGEIRVNTSTLDDKVLFKSSDMLPTYHLANVTDDYLMEISHVIRGEEWLPSLPLHVLLYRALGWEDKMPQFAHLPLLLKPTGNGKLSKRDGDKMGFPVFPLLWKAENGEVYRGYREDGYFPEAFVNLLALLGWNPGTERELFNMEELIQIFSLERVNKSGARFDPEKAKWFNHQYLIRKGNDEVANLFMPILEQYGVQVQMDKLVRIVGLVKERVNFIHELWGQTSFFFERPLNYNSQTVAKFWNNDSSVMMNILVEKLSGISTWTALNIEQSVMELIGEKGYGMGKVMNTIRLALVGESKGPGVADICEILGKEETLQRIRQAVLILGK
ncbi:MAG TPA: glutamate--tRNA ligase, partial [Tenuifilaceae bacterium]|nr:glutamate--tRNA ligase [Tenuifilaceae bacterium]